MQQNWARLPVDQTGLFLAQFGIHFIDLLTIRLCVDCLMCFHEVIVHDTNCSPLNSHHYSSFHKIQAFEKKVFWSVQLVNRHWPERFLLLYYKRSTFHHKSLVLSKKRPM